MDPTVLVVICVGVGVLWVIYRIYKSWLETQHREKERIKSQIRKNLREEVINEMNWGPFDSEGMLNKDEIWTIEELQSDLPFIEPTKEEVIKNIDRWKWLEPYVERQCEKKYPQYFSEYDSFPSVGLPPYASKLLKEYGHLFTEEEIDRYRFDL